MKNSQCYLCGSKDLKKRPGKVRDNASLEIFECNDCGLVFLSSFDHINSNFYENAKMHENEIDIDLQTWINESEEDAERRFEKFKALIKDKIILDFGCGCGNFLIRAKGIAQKTYGIELEKRLKPYFEEIGLTVYTDISQLEEKVDYIFMFHVLEHIKEPKSVLQELKKYLKPDGKIVIEVPNSDDALLTFFKNKAFSEFTYWSPHLYLYNEKTLKMLLSQAGYCSSPPPNTSIYQEQRYGFANHLWWILKGKPGGHNILKFLNNKFINKSYEKFLAKKKICDTIIGIFE